MPEQQSKEQKRTPENRYLKELQETRAALLNMLEDTEEARRVAEENRKRTQLIIRNLTDGLLVFNEKERLELINPRAEHLFLVRQKEVLGKDLLQLQEIPAMNEFGKILAQERDQLFRKELSLREHAVVEVTSSLFQPGKGEPGLLVMLHDITRERAIERMKTEFVSLAAHQLRTPLSAIKWTLQMMLEGDAGKLNKEQKGLLSKSYQSNERMIHLINDLLNVTRIEEGRYLYQPSFKQIEEVVASMVELYKDDASRREINLEASIPKGQAPAVLVDEEKIRLAIQNLLENALRYTEKGGKVTVGLSHDTKEVKVFVQDTGIGIPQNQQERLFEKFFRATNAKRVDTEGSGLGLYLVKNIVAAHGGRVWFESEEGKGTTLTFTLPIKRSIEEFLKKF